MMRSYNVDLYISYTILQQFKKEVVDDVTNIIAQAQSFASLSSVVVHSLQRSIKINKIDNKHTLQIQRVFKNSPLGVRGNYVFTCNRLVCNWR